ncbi:MAG: hypothetical protein EZS28_004636 [Streblomastix strix]|uniref:Uncharacterized protein n=1 Tax=Streblomastix strix TaxID=222440 RepID=A0A5J4WY76_9EUKA|nr:MAG: hypothetical protein EZS28_004636 [Streblomastix strix]
MADPQSGHPVVGSVATAQVACIKQRGEVRDSNRDIPTQYPLGVPFFDKSLFELTDIGSKMQHSDYVSGYLQLGEVLKSLSIHPQSFQISKQNFFDSPITELTSNGVIYIRAPLGARGKSACSMVQSCQQEDPLADWTTDMSQAEQGYFGKTAQGIESSEHLQFWIGFSTACGPFYQFQLMKDATALWGSAINARQQAVIS